MIIGVPKEIKTEENRVAVTPTGVAGFVARSHKVLIQKGAGLGSGLTDRAYETRRRDDGRIRRRRLATCRHDHEGQRAAGMPNFR